MKRNYTPVLLSNPLDAWFQDPFFGLDFGGRLAGYRPNNLRDDYRLAADFYEDEANYHARVELPGVKKEDVKVELEKDLLSISYAKKTEGEKRSESVSYSRSLRVPEGIDAEKISAKLEDGVLTVTLPKAEGAKRREIAVN